MLHATQEPICPWSPTGGMPARRLALAGRASAADTPMRGWAATLVLLGKAPPARCDGTGVGAAAKAGAAVAAPVAAMESARVVCTTMRGIWRIMLLSEALSRPPGGRRHGVIQGREAIHAHPRGSGTRRS